MTITHKLIAIMFTDIKDFTAKMHKNETATMKMLEIHNSIMKETIKKYDGKVIKTVGDAFLVTFDSAVNATQCAIEVQQRFINYNSNKSHDEIIETRIGIHIGEIVVKENDVFGDGVNIASRIQSIADVGGVNISDVVYQQIKGILPIRVAKLGAPQLKGVSEPIKIYRIIVLPTEIEKKKLATHIFIIKNFLKRKRNQRILALGFALIVIIIFIITPFLKKPPLPNSLAILPFRNIGDPANEYIADGFTEDLITYLSQLQGVKIIAKGSVFDLRNTMLSEKEIAKKLNVKYLLTGSLQSIGNNVRINTKLIDPEENTTIWAKNFDKPKVEILNVQHEIFREIALRFELMLSQQTNKKLISIEAYENYLRGLEYSRKERKDALQLAISLYTKAVELDTTFVQGYIKLASSQLVNYERQWDLNEKWLKEAESNIQKAYSLDSTNAEVFWLLGRLYIARGKRMQGLEFLERAIRMNPNLMRAYTVIGVQYLFYLNDPAKAISYFNKAYELEPTNYSTLTNLGIGYAYLKNYPEAIQAWRRAAVINPSASSPWSNLGTAYERMEIYDSAEAAYKRALILNPSDVIVGEYLAKLFLLRGKYFESDSILSLCLRYDPNHYGIIYTLGISKLWSGKKDTAFKIWNDGLRLAKTNINENPTISEHYLYASLFCARLGFVDSAIQYARKSIMIDSSEQNVLGLAQVYAISNKKQQMLEWYKRAKSMNPDYDLAFLKTSIDFYPFRNDPDLLMVARR